MSDYIYDPTTEEERQRLGALEYVLDPGTIRVFEQIGVSNGWHCLEVGGGGGSVTRWLSERVGPEGHVVATDLNTRFLEEIDAPNLEVRKRDVVTEPLEENAYDIVHSRDVLEHLAEREAVLDKMVAAVKPGGWLVAEDVDFVSALRTEGFGKETELKTYERKMWRAVAQAGRARGVDGEYGRRLPWRLAARGLTDVGADVRGGLAKAGSPGAILASLSTDQLRPLLLEGGMTKEEVEHLGNYIRSDEFMGFGPFHVAAWGRKPA